MSLSRDIMSLQYGFPEFPEDIMVLILQNIKDKQLLIDISGLFPNRYIFPCLFDQVSILPQPSSKDQFLLSNKSGKIRLKFSLGESNSVCVVDYRDSQFKFEQMDLIKKYISHLHLHHEKKDSDTVVYALKTGLTQLLFKAANVIHLCCSLKLSCISSLCGLRKLSLHLVLPFPAIDRLRNLNTLRLFYFYLDIEPTLYPCQSLKNLIIVGRNVNLSSLKVYPNLKTLAVTAYRIIRIQNIPFSLEKVKIVYYGQLSFSDLKESNLREVSITSLGDEISGVGEVISKSSKLISLNLHRVKIDQLPEVLRNKSLAYLRMESCQIGNLDTLSFPNLKTLNLEKTTLFETFWLDYCQCLTELNLEGCNLSSIDFVKNLPNLMILKIGRNQIKSAESLKQCSNLRKLQIRFNKLSFLDLENLKMLEPTLHVGNNRIYDLRLNDGLEMLDANNNRLTSTKSLSNLKSAKSLYLSANLITKLEGLEQLRCLKRLILAGNKITTLKGIEYLISLEVLDVANNRIKSLEGLDSLKNLVYFRSSRSKIEVLDGKLLQNFQGTFEMNFGVLKVIKNMNGLKLKLLDLSDNKIEILKEINNNSDIRGLYLQNNHIHTIENTFAELPSLIHLNLSNNKLKTLSGLENLNSDASLKIRVKNLELEQFDKSSLPYSIIRS